MARSTPQSFLLLIITAACGSAGGRPVIGFAYSGNGSHMVQLARAAAKADGIAGVEIRYDSMAPDETSEGAFEQAAGFVADPAISIVVGPSNSRHALATAPTYNAAGLAHIVPSATSRRLRSAGSYTFTLAPDDSVEGDHLARFAQRTLGAKRALLFYVNDEYGEGLRAGIVATFSEQGGEVLQMTPIGEGLDLQPLLAAAMRGPDPDVIFVAGRSREAAMLLKAGRRLAPGIPVVAGDGAYLPQVLLELAGPDLSGLYVLAFWAFDSSRADHRAFAERVRQVSGADPTPEDALTEDATMLALAAHRAGGSDRRAVQRWLSELGRSVPPFEGLTGRIAFGPARELPIRMVRFIAGRAEPVNDSLMRPPG